MFQSASTKGIILTLFVNAFLQYCTFAFDDPSSSNASSNNSNDNSDNGPWRQFLRVYGEIFTDDANQLEPPVVLEKLREARHLLDLTASRTENMPDLAAEIDEFIELSNDFGCQSATLIARLQLADQCRNHPVLEPYVQEYNRQQFERCAHYLDDTLSNHVNNFRDTDISRAAQFVRDMQIQENGQDHIALRMSIDFSSMCRGLIGYLGVLGRDELKPIERSMHDQNQLIVHVLSEFFDQDCQTMLMNLNEDLHIYSIIQHQNPSSRDLFKPEVIHLLDQTHICAFLMIHKEHIYPMGKYDFDQISDQILSTQLQTELMNPLKMRELLDISLFVGQAQLIIGTENTLLLSRYLDFLTVSQISANKCADNYIKAVLSVIQQNQGYPNLTRYLKYYGRLQMIECLPQLHFHIRGNVSQLSAEQFNLVIIDELVEIFNQVARQIETNVRLYREISYRVAHLSLERYLHEKGLNLQWPLDRNNENTLEAIRPQLRLLFESCENFAQTLDHLYARFIDLANLDTLPLEGSINAMNGDILVWMTRYKVCKTIVNLTSSIRIVQR